MKKVFKSIFGLLAISLVFSTMSACSNEDNEVNSQTPEEKTAALNMSFVSEGRTWKIRAVSSNPYHRDTTYFNHRLHGDTLINDIHYAQMYYSVEGEDEWLPTESYFGQSGAQVYKLTPLRNELVADFSLNVGDTFTYYIVDSAGEKPKRTYKITAVSDTILSSSSSKEPRRCLHLQNVNYAKDTMIWIDGIGDLKTGYVALSGDRLTGVFSKLMKCQQGDDVLYQSDED